MGLSPRSRRSTGRRRCPVAEGPGPLSITVAGVPRPRPSPLVPRLHATPLLRPGTGPPCRLALPSLHPLLYPLFLSAASGFGTRRCRSRTPAGVASEGQWALHMLRALSTNARIAALVASGMSGQSRASSARSGGNPAPRPLHACCTLRTSRSVPPASGTVRFSTAAPAPTSCVWPRYDRS